MYGILGFLSFQGVPCSYPRTTIGADGIPDPIGEKQPAKQVAQSLPQSTKKPVPAQQPKAASPWQSPSSFAAPSPQVPKPVPSIPNAAPQAWQALGTPHTVKVLDLQLYEYWHDAYYYIGVYKESVHT